MDCNLSECPQYVGQQDYKFKTNGYYRLFLVKDMEQI